MFETLKKLVSKRAKKARRQKTFVPQVDVLEDRRLLAPVTRFVDDGYTPAQLNATHFNSIQAAVTAANPGDKVRVLAGFYNESVVVDKKLVITGNFAPYVASGSDPSIDPTKASIVDGAGPGNTFTLNANDIVLQGFTLDNDGEDSVGVFTAPTTTGDKILANVIRDNKLGIYLNSNTSVDANTSAARRTLANGNTIFNNNETGGGEIGFAGAGNGIYSDQGLRNATIAGNRIFQQDNAAIILVGGPAPETSHSKLTIAGNVIGKFTAPGAPVNPDQFGAPIIIANTVDSSINGNVSYNSIGSGIFFAGGSTRDKVNGNFVTGAAFTGINVRFDPGSYNVADVNSQIDFIGNTVTYAGDSGIRLRDGSTLINVKGNALLHNGTGGFPETGDGISVETSDNNVVQGNTAKFNARNGISVVGSALTLVKLNTVLYNGNGREDSETGDGIALVGALNSQVQSNTAKFNARNGIFVDAASVDNLLQTNVSVLNNTRAAGAFDYTDESAGLGTAGTANTYKNNKGRTENRPGLIKTFI